QQVPTEDRYVLRRSELLDRVDVLLGGRVAEELVFGDVSTGAQNDLERATAMARHMVMQYGMSERLGLATFDDGAHPGLQDPRLPGDGRCSEHTARLIDDEVRTLLADAHARVAATLDERRDALERIAQRLLQCEVLEREALQALIDGRSEPEEPEVGHAEADTRGGTGGAEHASAVERDFVACGPPRQRDR
ncbi:FtsH-2 peptidase, partial [Burkholderia sp. TJI49]